MITVALSITVFLLALILVTVARYTIILKLKLKETKEENTSIRNRNCELVDQLNSIESKMQDASVNYGDRMVPLLPGNYRIEGVCNNDRAMCEAGCKTFTGGEVKHHKDCKYYPDSLSKYYDDLQYLYDQEVLKNKKLKAMPDFDTEYRIAVHGRLVFIGKSKGKFLYIPTKSINHSQSIIVKLDSPLPERLRAIEFEPPAEQWGTKEYFEYIQSKEVQPTVEDEINNNPPFH